MSIKNESKYSAINDLEPRQSEDMKGGATLNLESSDFVARETTTHTGLKWQDVSLKWQDVGHKASDGTLDPTLR